MEKKLYKKIIWFTVILFIIGIIFYPKVKPLFEKKQGPDPMVNRNLAFVKTMVIVPGLLQEAIRVSGSLSPDEEVDLSFESSGKVTAIYFEEGTRVEKGRLLAKLNDEALKAQHDKLLVQEKLLTERENRQRILLSKEAVSRESYDFLTSEIQAIEAEIRIIKTRIRETELYAPFDGIIGLRSQSPGAIVNTNTVIARLVKVHPLKVDFSIPERYSGFLKPGAKLTFSIEGHDNSYEATVYAIDPKVDPMTRSISVRAYYDNKNENLKPGRFVTIDLIIRQKDNAIEVPAEAVIPEMDGEKVFVVRDGKANHVIISTGLRTEKTIEVLSRLVPGDSLVISGIMQLRHLMPVRVLNDKINEND